MNFIKIAKDIGEVGLPSVVIVSLAIAVIKLYRDKIKLDDTIQELNKQLLERMEAEIKRAESQADKYVKQIDELVEVQSKISESQTAQMRALEIILRTGGSNEK